MHQEDQQHNTAPDKGERVEKTYWNKPQPLGQRQHHKPFVIEQKVLHHRLHECRAHCASSLHINSLIFECGILTLRGIEAQTHSSVCKDTKAYILGFSFLLERDHLLKKYFFFWHFDSAWKRTKVGYKHMN